MFLLASALAVFFVFREVSPFFRFVVFFPYFLSMLGFLQAKERTCVVFAAKGIQDVGQGEEKVSDAGLSRLLKIKGQKIIVQASFLALLLTIITIFVR